MAEQGPHLIRPLMARFVYLNNLRVGVTTFYATIVTALFAIHRMFPRESSTMVIGNTVSPFRAQPVVALALATVLMIGILVFLFDLRCRARASVAAQWIRKYENDRHHWQIDYDLAPKQRRGEDFYFSMITMIINSLLAAAIVAVSTTDWIQLPLAYNLTIIATFSVALWLQAAYHQQRWPKFAQERKRDPWPDDDLLSKPNTKETDDRNENAT